jgi:hypothetical protein
LGRINGSNSKSWVRPTKICYTKIIFTSRPPRSCVHSHHAMFVGNTVGTNALKLYSFLLCHDPHSVNCDNLCSRTPIENVKMETCTKFQEEDKTLRLWGCIVPCNKVHKNMWMIMSYIDVNLLKNLVWSTQQLQSLDSKHDCNHLTGVYKSQTWPSLSLKVFIWSWKPKP